MYAWADRTTTYRYKANKLQPVEQGLFQECLTTDEQITNSEAVSQWQPEAIACVYFSQTKVCGYNNIGASTGMSFSIAKSSFLA